SVRGLETAFRGSHGYYERAARAGLVRGFPNIAVLPDRPPNEVAALQAGRRSGSRMTSLPPSDSSASVRLVSRTKRTASTRLERASSSVSPWVLAPGSSSTKAPRLQCNKRLLVIMAG